MADRKTEYRKKDTFWRRWGAVFILIAFFFASWGGHFAAQLQQAKNDSAQHGQAFSMEEFWPQFWSSTLENWQSEWLQLAAQAILISALADYFFRKGNQDHYETQLMIEDLQKQIKSLKS